MHDALVTSIEVSETAPVPLLVALADMTQSLRADDDPQREKVIAKCCVAGLLLGHSRVLCVIGADHLDAVEQELQTLGEGEELDMMSLEAELAVDEEFDEPDSPTRTSPLFVSKDGIAAILAYRQKLYDEYGSDTERLSAALSEKDAGERFGCVSGMEDYNWGRPPTLNFLQGPGHMIKPASIAELSGWWGSCGGK